MKSIFIAFTLISAFAFGTASANNDFEGFDNSDEIDSLTSINFECASDIAIGDDETSLQLDYAAGCFMSRVYQPKTWTR